MFLIKEGEGKELEERFSKKDVGHSYLPGVEEGFLSLTELQTLIL